MGTSYFLHLPLFCAVETSVAERHQNRKTSRQRAVRDGNGEPDPRARHGLSKGRGVTVLIPGTVLVSQAKGGQRVWGSASKSHSFSCGLLASPAPLNHNLPSLEPQSEKSALRRGTDLSHKPGEFPGLSTHGLFSHKPRRLVALKEPEHFLPIL